MPPTDHSAMKLGRRAVRHDRRTLMLTSYVEPDLPQAPDVCTWSKKASGWSMFQNDRLGDCTAATAGHLIRSWSANASSEITLTDDAVIDFYSRASGYDPAYPETDHGAIELDVLREWRGHGCGGHGIGAYVFVTPSCQTLTQDAVFLFGGLYIGLALPLSSQRQNVWDVPPGGTIGDGAQGSWGGHAVPVLDYDPRGLNVVTWGGLKRMTWEFYQAYCDEAYAILSPDFVTGAIAAPNGFDLSALQLDLSML